MQSEQTSSGRHSLENRKEDFGEENTLMLLSFSSLLKIGFVKLTKLNYTSISTFTFHMLHCVTINGSRHLYLYGDHQCYAWWQYVIMILVLPIVLLFPLSFGIALDLMKEGMISTNQFLFATVCPPYAIILRIKMKKGCLSK